MTAPSARSASTGRTPVAVSTLVAGSAGLAIALRLAADSRALIPLMLVIAGVWVAGAVACTRPGSLSRPSLRAVAPWFAAGIGCALIGAALADGLAEIGILESSIGELARLADTPVTAWVVAATVANGIGEELFFRGSLADLVPPAHAYLSPAAYVAVTATTGNAVLVVASVVMAGLATTARRRARTVWASAAFHCGFTLPLVWILPQVVPSQ